MDLNVPEGFVEEDMDIIRKQLYIKNMRSKKRVLDGPPPKIKLSRLTDPTICGYAASILSTYNSMAVGTELPAYSVEIFNGKVVTCDRQVHDILSTLIVSNVNPCQRFSKACADLFIAIVMCGKDHITKETMYSVLKEFQLDSYEKKVVVSTVCDIVFGDGAQFEWNYMLQGTKLYPNLRSYGAQYISDNKCTVKEWKTLLKENYNKAKEDEDFMKNVLKGVPKHMVGALYLFHKEHPDVMEAVVEDDGFMKGGEQK